MKNSDGSVYLTFDGSSIDINADKFDLNAGNLTIESDKELISLNVNDSRHYRAVEISTSGSFKAANELAGLFTYGVDKFNKVIDVYGAREYSITGGGPHVSMYCYQAAHNTVSNTADIPVSSSRLYEMEIEVHSDSSASTTEWSIDEIIDENGAQIAIIGLGAVITNNASGSMGCLINTNSTSDFVRPKVVAEAFGTGTIKIVKAAVTEFIPKSYLNRAGLQVITSPYSYLNLGTEETKIVGNVTISKDSRGTQGYLYVGSKILTNIGTASAPSITFTLDDNTGLFRYGTDAIGFACGGVGDFKMDSGGDFHADGNITAYSSTVSSDIRLKENIKALENNLDKILELKPSSFTWKVRKQQDDIGLIAQEVEKIIPEIVNETESIGLTEEFLDGDTHKTVDYAKLSIYLIGAIQEQQEQIEFLQERVTTLELGSNPK
jgi:hypothetical protein